MGDDARENFEGHGSYKSHQKTLHGHDLEGNNFERSQPPRRVGPKPKRETTQIPGARHLQSIPPGSTTHTDSSGGTQSTSRR